MWLFWCYVWFVYLLLWCIWFVGFACWTCVWLIAFVVLIVALICFGLGVSVFGLLIVLYLALLFTWYNICLYI